MAPESTARHRRYKAEARSAVRVCFVDGGPSFFTTDRQKDIGADAARRRRRLADGKIRDMGGDGEETRQSNGLWRGQGPRGRETRAVSRRRPKACAVGEGAISHVLRSSKATRRRQMDKENKGMVEGMMNRASIPQSRRRSVSQLSQEVPRLEDRAPR